MRNEGEQRTEDPMLFGRAFFERALSPVWVNGESFVGATGFAIDSRKIGEGEVFVALKTDRRNGHDFLNMVWEKKAAAALVSEPNPEIPLPQIVVKDSLAAFQRLGREWRKQWGGRVIAVTGSCGKTSTKEMLGVLLGADRTFVTPGNLNNYLGIPLCELQLREKHRIAVLEAGINEPGEMVELADMLLPEVAVVTTIAAAHLEKLGSLEGVAREKSVLAQRATESVFLGPACGNYDSFAENCIAAPIQTIRAKALPATTKSSGSTWTYRVEEGFVVVESPAGEVLRFAAPEGTAGMLENACLAAMVAHGEGVVPGEIAKRLSTWKPAAQRGEILTVGGRTVYGDYYNANPGSMIDAALYFAQRFPEGGRVWVIGGMEELGASAQQMHEDLATKLPVQPGDRVFLVGGHTPHMAPILRTRLGSAPSVVEAAEAEAIAATVASTEGVLFLKGSRKFHLETILDALTALHT